MTIARRLILLLAVPLLAFLAMGAFTGLELARIETSTRFVADFRIAAPATLGNLKRHSAELRVAIAILSLKLDGANGPARVQSGS